MNRNDQVAVYAVLFWAVVFFMLACAGFVHCVYGATDTINTVPDASDFLTELQEFLEDETGDLAFRRHSSVVLRGGWHSTSANLSATVPLAIAFVDGYYVGALAEAQTYTASTRTFVYLRKDDTAAVSVPGAVITYGSTDTSWVFAEAAAGTNLPEVPVGVLPTMYVDTDGTSITATTDLRGGEIPLAYFRDEYADLWQEAPSDTSETAYRRTVTFSAPFVLEGNTTIPENVCLKPLGGARVFLGARTLTINGTFEAEGRQVFVYDGVGTVSFSNTSVPCADPRWWGAAVDATTDDSEEIEYAWNSGVPACLCEGNWRVETTISSPSVGVLRGSGPGTSILVPDTGHAGAKVIDITSDSFVTISDLTIVVTAATPVTGTDAGIIVADRAEKLHIANIYTPDNFTCSYPVIDLVGGCDNAVIRNCILENGGSGGCVAVRGYGTAGAAYDTDTVAITCNVFQCTSGPALSVNGQNNDISNVSITGNTLQRVNSTGIALQLAGTTGNLAGTLTEVACVGNSVWGSVAIYSSASRVLFSNNVVDGPASGASDGIIVASTGGGSVPTYITVSNNTIYDGARYGASCSGTNCIIRDNDFLGVSNTATILVSGDSCRVVGNTMTPTGATYGIVGSAANNFEVVGNTINNSDGTAIYYLNGAPAANIAFDDNRIIDTSTSTDNGIWINAGDDITNLSICRNDIYGVDLSAIEIDGNTNNINEYEIRDNAIDGSSVAFGVYLHTGVYTGGSLIDNSVKVSSTSFYSIEDSTYERGNLSDDPLSGCVTLASPGGGTLDLSENVADCVYVTGTNAITAIDVKRPGSIISLHYAATKVGAIVDAAALRLDGGINFDSSEGDIITFISNSQASGWLELSRSEK